MHTLETVNINKMTAKNLTLLTFLLLAGCSYLPHILYKIDVQQGNVVTDEMVEKLKPGMTKSQVLFVMGSPLIVDTFRDNRWDYVYIFREKGDLVEQKRLTIFFENDALVNIENHLVFSKDPIKPKLSEGESDSDKVKPEDVETK
jgi:outer membrane protein assembly factor BamE